MNYRKLAIFSLLLLSALTLVASLPHGDTAPSRKVLILTVEGTITVAKAEYVEINLAQASQYEAVIIIINTFGGLGDAMFRIIDRILHSEVPVIVYVYPPGGQALSAGTYILMASSLAVMAPYTVIGSAQPVVDGQPTSEPKIINFLVERMRTYTELHGRNSTQAVRFITENDDLRAEEALRLGVIELIANDLQELLEKADGMTVKTLKTERKLNLRAVVIEERRPDFRIQFIDVISDPLVSGLLLSFGVLLLVVGLTTPGFGIEIAGIVLILLGLVGQGFNVNWIGFALITIGAILTLYEFYTGGIGLAIAAGITLVGLGIIFLVRGPGGEIFISPQWFADVMNTLIVVSIGIAALMGFLVYKALRVVRRRTFSIEVKGVYGRAVEDISKDSIGYVFIGGEYKRALAVEDVKMNERVQVVGESDGLLRVKRATSGTR
ncbi:MAG: nodulation protein NfeD [Aigarchaeota archaeon]|nr:nodulation protein NfeD [Aigarchaeota archaeon]MDW8093287.1 nodulation protein NfeD [Nitrososphaerota archaeon]